LFNYKKRLELEKLEFQLRQIANAVQAQHSWKKIGE